DSLLVVFALAAWLLFLRGLEPGSRWSRMAHPIAWLAALLSKEAALVLPLVMAGHLLLVERRPWRRLLAPWVLGGWAGAIAIYAGARAAVLPAGSELGAAGLPAARLLANVPLFATSLGKLALPVHLSVLATPEDSWWLPGVIAAIALVAAALFVPRV